MPRYRLAALVALIFTVASVATPHAQQLPVREQFPQLPQNPYCLKAACGYGRDGIVEPYTGGGLRGTSAREVKRIAMEGRMPVLEADAAVGLVHVECS